MAKPKVVATIIQVKGTCHAHHKVGDTFTLNGIETGGVCGWLYHNLFPNLIMMSNGGGPSSWKNPGAEKTQIIGCPDRENEVLIELKVVE